MGLRHTECAYYFARDFGDPSYKEILGVDRVGFSGYDVAEREKKS